jgi:hypothetical protein
MRPSCHLRLIEVHDRVLPAGLGAARATQLADNFEADAVAMRNPGDRALSRPRNSGHAGLVQVASELSSRISTSGAISGHRPLPDDRFGRLKSRGTTIMSTAIPADPWFTSTGVAYGVAGTAVTGLPVLGVSA